MAKTIAEINKKIKAGKAVVLTAEEMSELVHAKGAAAAARKVDVVTTGTFGPMCSSSAYLNIGHSRPKIKLGGGKVTLGGVEAYTGLAAVDLLIGATALQPDDPRNKPFPGEFSYGGGHVIEDLVAGKDVPLVAEAYGTDCYPRKRLETLIRLADLNEAVLFNPRNAYQNYNVAVNLSNKVLYTYLGVLKPRLGNANYCSAGQLSPLLNDPEYRTIGVGTRIFLGGGEGYVAWHGTQHSPAAKRDKNGLPVAPAGTLAVIGDLKGMDARWLRGASFLGYGSSLVVGIGVPIPVLDERVARAAGVRDEDISAPVVDYSKDYPEGTGQVIGHVDYKSLRSGVVTIKRKKVPTASFSSYARAREIAGILKERISAGKFLLSEPVAPLPGAASGISVRALTERA